MQATNGYPCASRLEQVQITKIDEITCNVASLPCSPGSCSAAGCLMLYSTTPESPESPQPLRSASLNPPLVRARLELSGVVLYTGMYNTTPMKYYVPQDVVGYAVAG